MIKTRLPRGALTLLAVLVGALASGCSWFGFGKDEKPPAPLPDYRPVAQARIVWQQTLESPAQPGFSPSVMANTVYAATPEGTLASFEGATGRPNWRVKTGSKLTAAAGSDGATIVVGTGRGEVLAYDPSGKQRWRSRVTSEVMGPPRISDNTVAVFSGDGNVFGLAASDGGR